MNITRSSQSSNQYSQNSFIPNMNNININNIPYAKSISSSNITKNNNPNISSNYYRQNYFPNTNTMNESPLISRTPFILKDPNNTYKQAYNNCNIAKDMLQTRLNKLMYQKKLLGELGQNPNSTNNNYDSMYKLRTMSNARGKLSVPPMYNNHLPMEPIYYPLEMPLAGEPIALPNIEIGGSMRKKSRGGLDIESLIPLLAMLRKRRPQPAYVPPPQPQIIYPPAEEPIRGRKKLGGENKIIDQNKNAIIPETIKEDKKKKKLPMKRDWWRLCRDFVNIYTFFSTGRKYAGFAKVRDNIINSRIKAMVQDITVLKEWVISITQNFWDEFKVFTDLNVSFKNLDSKIKITKESQKIIALIKKYLETLISRSTKLIDIPERVQQILYSYIRDKGYYPKNYLTTYQINRIDYNFYGGTKNLQGDQVGMLVAMLIISGITVQQILLHMRDCFIDFKNYPNIEITAKYVGSIMHYLVRDTFNTYPTMLKEVLALMNYYRNYHIYNKEVEEQNNVFGGGSVEFKDIDEFADYLVPESTITEFWNLNPQFVDMFKNYVYSWATRLGKLIRLKYEKSDTNLLPKRGLQKPQIRTANIEEEKNEDEED